MLSMIASLPRSCSIPARLISTTSAAGHQRGERLEVVLALRERDRLLARGLDDVAERRLQQRQDLADEARLALAAGVELARLIAQQHDGAVAPEALHRLVEHLFDE